MQTNIILAGVGGQGILSVAFVIDMAAVKKGLRFKQAEVHGMSQRGGEVQSHLRLSDQPIHSDLVPAGMADLVLSVEPLESLRYVGQLSPAGTLVTSIDPFVNINDYPEYERILEALGKLPSHTLVHADRLAREAGTAKAQNMVLLGAASPFLGLGDALLEECINESFARKGERIQATNISAFRAGKAAGEAYRACLKAGIPPRAALTVVGRLKAGVLQPEAIPVWTELLSGALAAGTLAALETAPKGRLAGTPEVPRAILATGDGARAAEQLE